MIAGRTEKEYRALPVDSSSSLKEFSLDRKKYYKKYVKGEKVEDKDSAAATMGRLVETLLFEPEEFDGRFHMSSLVSAPTGLMLEFVEALYKLTVEATDENGNVTRSFEDISRDAYTLSGFKIKYDAVIGKFVGSDAEIYYNEIRQVRSRGLSIVTADDVANAEKVVNELKTNDFTHEVINKVSSSRWEVFNQLQIDGFEIEGLKLKGMLDRVIIDHEKKTVQPYDLKCVWAVENFYEEYYLYRRAYIQAYVYYTACMHLLKDLGSEYKALPLRFIVCDSTNYYAPLIYTMDNEDMMDAWEGFTHKGKKYPGVYHIIKDLKWALENNIWNISRENHKRNGTINIKG